MKPKLFDPKEAEQWGPIDMRLLYPSFWFGPMSGTVKSKWGIYWARMYGIIRKDQGTFYWERGSLENEGIKAIKRWLLPASKRNKVISEYWPLIEKIKNIVEAAEKLGPNASFENIKPLAIKWQQLYYNFWSLADVFEIANYGSPFFLSELLKKYVPQQQIESVMEVLLAPEKISFNQQNQKELLECLLKAKSNLKLKLLLVPFAHKWFWLNNSYYESVKLNADYFYKKISKITRTEARNQLNEINQYPAVTKQRKNEVVKKYNLPKSVVNIASVLSLSIWIQDDRKSFAWRSSETVTMFSKFLAKKLGISLAEVLHYSADEWLLAFQKEQKLPTNLLTRRKKLCVMYSKTGFYTFFYGSKAKTLANHFEKSKILPPTSTYTSLQGIVVSKNDKPITGKVRILKSARNIGQMKKGEILVTSMTSPDYIHAMRIAKAIITDVGGLMSHAAVVSRELGIPCIVNTKIATKVLKDGDMVEVDATKGIVKKL